MSEGPLLVTGAGGLLGQALAAQPGALGLDRAALDITDPAAVRAALRALRPRALINAAAQAGVDRAELEPAATFAVNDVAVGILAACCAELGVRFVHISTDYVLRGAAAPGLLLDEGAPLGPVGVYARSKAQGEAAALAHGAVVARVQWVYAAQGRGFFAAALRRMVAGEPLRLVPDQLGCPTPAPLLARWLCALAEGGPVGLYHLATTGETSPADWLSAAARLLGQDLRWTPLPRAELGPVPRPARSCLDGARARRDFGLEAVDWHAALEAELRRAGPLPLSRGPSTGG